MTRSPSLSDNSGFTLLEVLIAIVIFSVGLMAVGFLQASSLKETGDIARKTEAWAVADGHASWLKSLIFYTDVPTQTFNPNLVAGVYNQPAPVPYNTRYRVWWQVTDTDTYDNTAIPVLPGVGAGNYVVAKNIVVTVTPLGGNMGVDDIAQVEFVKTWAATRIPDPF